MKYSQHWIALARKVVGDSKTEEPGEAIRKMPSLEFFKRCSHIRYNICRSPCLKTLRPSQTRPGLQQEASRHLHVFRLSLGSSMQQVGQLIRSVIPINGEHHTNDRGYSSVLADITNQQAMQVAEITNCLSKVTGSPTKYVVVSTTGNLSVCGLVHLSLKFWPPTHQNRAHWLMCSIGSVFKH